MNLVSGCHSTITTFPRGGTTSSERVSSPTGRLLHVYCDYVSRFDICHAVVRRKASGRPGPRRVQALRRRLTVPRRATQRAVSAISPTTGEVTCYKYEVDEKYEQGRRRVRRCSLVLQRDELPGIGGVVTLPQEASGAVGERAHTTRVEASSSHCAALSGRC